MLVVVLQALSLGTVSCKSCHIQAEVFNHRFSKRPCKSANPAPTLLINA